jgi:hypothetical protein
MAAWLSAGRVLGALIAALALASACSGDSSSAPGGSAGNPSGARPGSGGGAGKGHAAGGSGAALGNTGGSNASGSGGAAGGGNEGGAESGGSTSTATGSFDSIWKQTKADVLAFDGAGTAIPKQVTVDVPGLYSVPYEDASADVEVYQSIQNGVLITYARPAGASSYYRIKSALAGAGGIYTYSLGSKFSGIYQLVNGVLTFSASFSFGTLVGTSTAHFEKYTGDFPPATWPSDVVELDLTTGGAP